MILYLVRHGVAVEGRDWDGPDESRPLTDEGREKMEEAARGVAELKLEIRHVFASPLVRARQTAEIFCEALKLPKPKILGDLAPEGMPLSILNSLAGVPAGDGALLAGHEPSMGYFASFLLGLDLPIPFKKGAMMAIEFDGRAAKSGGRMVWYMPVKVMKNLG